MHRTRDGFVHPRIFQEELRQDPELKWIPRRKETSPPYLQGHQHATSCNCFAMQAAQRIFLSCREQGGCLVVWLGRSVDLDLHRIWEGESLQASRPAWDRDELVSSLVCSPFPRLRGGRRGQGPNIPILAPTAGNMAWFIRVTWVIWPSPMP